MKLNNDHKIGNDKINSRISYRNNQKQNEPFSYLPRTIDWVNYHHIAEPFGNSNQIDNSMFSPRNDFLNIINNENRFLQNKYESENQLFNNLKIENHKTKLINNKSEIKLNKNKSIKLPDQSNSSTVEINKFNLNYFGGSRMIMQNAWQNTKPLDPTVSKPIGFENPKGNCFLNCVVQQFYSCTEFRNKLIKFQKNCQIADINADEKKIFVNNFCKLLEEITKRDNMKIQEYVSEFQRLSVYSFFKDDVYTCFMSILTVLSDVTKKQKKIKISAETSETPQHYFQIYRNKNYGFVFDLFYGQMVTKLVCNKCQIEFNKHFQLFKSILLPLPKTTEMIPLENVIKNYLSGSPVDTDDKMNCWCPGGSKNLYSIMEFTHMPSYLFINLNRGSYIENGEKNNTFINCNEILTFPTGESSTKYRLISVIDHIGDNYGGYYYAKSCFETDQWWILKDSSVNLIEDKKSIVTEHAIVFLFKKNC